jgi:hypothetical protein
MAVKGVVKVVPLENRIAVCAETTYAAIRAGMPSASKWSKGPVDLNDDAIWMQGLQEHLRNLGCGRQNEGRCEKALGKRQNNRAVLQNQLHLPRPGGADQLHRPCGKRALQNLGFRPRGRHFR